MMAGGRECLASDPARPAWCAASDHRLEAARPLRAQPGQLGLANRGADLPQQARLVLAQDEARLLRQVRAAIRQPELRSEEHTSELQSREKLVCRLLLEKT